MNDEYVEATIEPSKQIDEYLNLSGQNNNKQSRLSFEEIISNFIEQFPDRAEIFVNDGIARSTYGLLKQAANLLESYFSKIDFECYLRTCIANDCHSRRVCEFLRNNYPANKLAMFELLTE